MRTVLKRIFVFIFIFVLLLSSSMVSLAVDGNTTMPKDEKNVVHSGNRSLKFSKVKGIDSNNEEVYNAPWGKALYTYIPLTAGKSYRFTIWVHIPEAKNRDDISFFAALTWMKSDYVESINGRTPWIEDGVANMKYPTPALVPAAEGKSIKDELWHKITCYYTVAPKGDMSALNPSPGTSDTYSLLLWTEEDDIDLPPLTSGVYIDDVEVVEVDANKNVTGTNLIKNPGFEDELSQIAVNWSNAVSVYYGVGTNYGAPIPFSSAAPPDDDDGKGNSTTGDRSGSQFALIAAVTASLAVCVLIYIARKRPMQAGQ